LALNAPQGKNELEHDLFKSNYFVVTPAKAGVQNNGASLAPGSTLSRGRREIE